MTVPGTSVTALDTDTGGALVFVTTGEPSELRVRVAGWAARHNARHGAMGPLPTGGEPAASAGGHDHHHHHHASPDPAEPVGSAADPADLIATHSGTTAVDVDGGARLDVVTFPDQLGALQAELHAHAERLAVAGCGGR